MVSSRSLTPLARLSIFISVIVSRLVIFYL